MPGTAGAVALSAPTAGDAVLLGPTASASGSLSTTWYCAGGPSGQGDGGRTTLVLANRSPVTSRAQVTVFGNGVATQRRVVQVLGSSRLELSLTSILKAPTTGAVIEGTGGGLAVSQRLTTPSGADATPCGTRASSQWYFADGSTAEGATQTITLFNPFPDPVTADVSFLTVDGYRQPPPFSGVPVPPGSVVVARRRQGAEPAGLAGHHRQHPHRPAHRRQHAGRTTARAPRAPTGRRRPACRSPSAPRVR